MKVITIATQKGGTGKTATAAALAQAAAKRGRRVLAIDLDPQGNLSYSLAARAGGPENAYNLLNGDPAADNIVAAGNGQGLDVVPACYDLATITSGKASARRLEKALGPVWGYYDYVFIDTPATVGELLYNALQAADGLLIPLNADAYNIQSLYQITDVAAQIRDTSNPNLFSIGVIITRFYGRTKYAQQIRDAIEAQAADLGLPFLGTIRQTVAIQEATALQESLYKYAPRSTAAADYLALFDTIEKRMQEAQ